MKIPMYHYRGRLVMDGFTSSPIRALRGVYVARAVTLKSSVTKAFQWLLEG